jgi:hypothetical protein
MLARRGEERERNWIMARPSIAQGGAAVLMVTALAASLGGCGSARNVIDDFSAQEMFSGFARGLPGIGTDTGFTVSRGAADNLSLPATTAADYVGADGQCQGGAVTPSQGVALTITECQMVAVAGAPTQISIAGDEAGNRRAVLTYDRGGHAGIYTFVAGRLKIVERLPTPPKPERRRATKRQRT